MRVILRPAALLIEPFSSARLLFFPLPVRIGKEGPIVPDPSSVPSLQLYQHGDWPRSLDLSCLPEVRLPAPKLQVLPLDLTDSYHVHGQDWNSCRPLLGCQSLRSASLGTASVEGGGTHSPSYKVDKMILRVGSICLLFTSQYHVPVMGSTARTWGG